MPEKSAHFIFESPAWTLIALFVMAIVSRTLLSDEPFKLKKFAGEIVLAVIGAILLFSFGVLEGMTPPQLVLAGGLGSLGGVRLLEWGIKVYRKLKAID